MSERAFARIGLPLILAALYLAIYILPLGVRSLAVPDETRYAEIPREMIAHGQWVVPHLNGLRYFEKPVLGYWIHAGSLLLFGKNNFAVRLPSALSVALSALLIYFMMLYALRTSPGRADSPEDPDIATRWAAGLAVLIFLTSGMVLGIGTFAVLDSLFALFLTACIACLFFALEAPARSAREKRLLALTGIACGLAFLTKGLLAGVFLGLVMVSFLCWHRRWREVPRIGLFTLAWTVLVILPWSVLIHLREPDFWNHFFWNEHIQRYLSEDAQHSASFWLFFLALPLLIFPWTLMVPAFAVGLPAVLRTTWQDKGPRGRLLRLALCWFVLPVLFLSTSRGKLMTYILPCMPPLAVLLGLTARQIHDAGQAGPLVRGAIRCLIGLAGLAAMVFLALQLFGVQNLHLYAQPEKTALAVCAVTLTAVIGLCALRVRQTRCSLLLFGAAAAVLYAFAPFLTPNATERIKMPGPFLEQHQNLIEPTDLILTDSSTVTAGNWYLARNDLYLFGGGHELSYGLEYPDSRHRLVRSKTVMRLIQEHHGRVVVFAKQKSLNRWALELPEWVLLADSGPAGYALVQLTPSPNFLP